MHMKAQRSSDTGNFLSRALNAVKDAAWEVKHDLDSVVERDPAARNAATVALLYPGVHAIWAHRVSHTLWTHGAYFPARAISQASRFATNIEIHPGATIGSGVFIDHGAGVVIGETAVVGDDCTIYHGVTLGGTTLGSQKRHPTIGDRVTVGAGAKVLGNLTVGDDSRIGANAVLVRSVDHNSVVVGVPGQVVAHGTSEVRDTKPKQETPNEPDPVGKAVQNLLARVQQLEVSTNGHTSAEVSYESVSGVWEVQDFSI